MKCVHLAVVYLLASLGSLSQAAPTCTAGIGFQQYNECPNTSKPILVEASPGQCPGVGCVPVAYAECEHPTHGLDKARGSDLGTMNIQTGWLYGGGRNQNTDCEKRIEKFNEDNLKVGVVAVFEATVPEQEKSENIAGAVRYNYTCRSHISRYAFVKKASVACSVAAYKVRAGEALERRPECQPENRLQRVSSQEELKSVQGVAGNWCLSCSDQVSFTAAMRCVLATLETVGPKSNNSLLTDADKAALAKTACRVVNKATQPLVKKALGLSEEDYMNQITSMTDLISDTKTDCSAVQ